MARKLTVYDPAEDLGYIARALGVVARARGMAQIAARTGLSRVQLYRSFSPAGNPSLKTVVAVMSALGVELAARPPAERAAKPRRQVKRVA